MKDVVSHPLTWRIAVEVRAEIMRIPGAKKFRKPRLAVLEKLAVAYPTLDTMLTEEPTAAEKEVDRKKAPQTLTLTRAEWEAIAHGFQVRLQSEETDGEAAGVLRAAKLLRMRGECLKALPEGEAEGKSLPDGEAEAEPDAA